MKDFATPEEAFGFVEQSAIFDLNPWVPIVRAHHLYEFMKPAPEGVWVKGRVDPVLLSGKTYFLAKSSSEVSNIKNLEDAKSFKCDILNDAGDVVFNYLKSLSSVYAAEANPAYVPVRFLTELARCCVAGLSSDPHTRANYLRLGRYFVDNDAVVAHMDKDGFMFDYSEFLSPIAQYVSARKWHIHHVYQRGLSLFVDRGVDWRIVKYYELIQDPDKF